MLFHAMLKAAALQNDGPAYRYWAIYIVDNNGGANTRLGEIELRGTPGGPTLTTPTMPVTCSSSTSIGTLANLVDGNPATAWATAAVANSRIRLDFGVATKIKQVGLCPHNAFLTPMPRNFRVEGSDDGTTFDVVGTFYETGWTAGTFKSFDL